MINGQLGMMANALQGGQMQPPPDQAMNPMGMGGAPQAASGGGMGLGNILGGGNMGLLSMLMQGGGPMGLMKMLSQKKDSDGNPNAAADTPSPGEFNPGGQSNPSSTSVTPF